MKIELSYHPEVDADQSKIRICAVDDEFGYGMVADGCGDTLETAVKDLVSRFAELQQATIDALHDSGLVKYVKTSEDGGLS